MIYSQEKFPVPAQREPFMSLWAEHGMEVRGQPLDLNFARYEQIEREKRLIWIVAYCRPGKPVGYSCHWWYDSIHFKERWGHDDLWFVTKGWRGLDIGRTLKHKGLDALRAAGAVMTEDLIRAAAPIDKLMGEMGYQQWGTRWTKRLTGPAGS